MASKFTPIAPIFLQDTLNSINEANLRSIYTYKSYAGSPVEIPDMELVDTYRDQLNYIRYPENVKPFVKRTNSAMELQHAMVEALEFQQSGSYLPKDKVRSLRLLQDFWHDTAQDALRTTVDIETFGAPNFLGVEQSSIYHATFKHTHKGKTFGAFKGDDKIQSFFIGVTDDSQKKYLKDIADIVSTQGIQGLSKDQKVSFEYLARAGASITDTSQITDITNMAAHLTLTQEPIEKFGTLTNYNKMVDALIERGNRAMATGKEINGHRISSDMIALANNVAEVIANSSNSIVIGWNVPFDANHIMSTLGQQPGMREYLQERVAALTGKNARKIPALADLGIFRRNMIDPYHDIVRTANIDFFQDFIHRIYGNSSRSVTEAPELLGFETIAAAQGLDTTGYWTEAEKLLFTSTHHDAYIDTLQEDLVLGGKKSILADVYDPWVQQVIDKYEEIEGLKSNGGAGGIHISGNRIQGFQGLIIEAQTSGSLQQIGQYDHNILATVKGSNGDIFTSNGMRLTADKRLMKMNQYLPGAWSAGVPYEIVGGDIIDQSSDLAKELQLLNPALAGEDIVQFNLKSTFLDSNQVLSESALETRTVYVPESMSSRFIAKNFRIIGQRDKDGEVIFNAYAEESQRAKHISDGYSYSGHITKEGAPANLPDDGKKYRARHIVTADDIEKQLKEAQQNKAMDRAERSFTKHSLATDLNVLTVRNLLDNGTYQTADKVTELHKAILMASQGSPGQLESILQGSSIQSSAADIVKIFKVGKKEQIKEFSNAWLTNVLTIANVAKKGSLYDQTMSIGLNILSRPEYQHLGSYDQGQIYSQIVNSVFNYSKLLLPQLNEAEYEAALDNSVIKKAVDTSRYYYLNVMDFARKYRPDNYVPKTEEEALDLWMKIDLQNPWSVMNEVKRITGLQGENVEDWRLRRNLIDFADWASHNPDFTRQERRDFKTFFRGNLDEEGNIIGKRRKQKVGYKQGKNGQWYPQWARVGPLIGGKSNRHFSTGLIESKNPAEISGELVQIFSRFSNRAATGNVPSTVYSELLSPFTQMTSFTGSQAQRIQAELLPIAEATAKEARNMIGASNHDKQVLTDRLRRLILGQIDNYDELIQDYDEPMRKMLSAIYESHRDAARAIATGFVEGLSGTGISLSVGNNSAFLKFGNSPDFDITDYLPKLRTNTIGTMSWIFNPRETKYVAASMIELNDDMGIRLGSMMEYAYRDWFKSMNSKIKTNIEMGENPLTLIQWYLTKPAELNRKMPAISGMPAGDMRNLLYAYTQPMFSEKSVRQIVNLGRNMPLNESQEYSINILEKYLSGFGKINDPVIGEAEEEALTNLLFGENAIMSSKITNIDNVNLMPAAKQTGAEGVRYTLAQMPGVFELQSDINGIMQSQLDNSIYFNTSKEAWQNQILEDGNINLRYGPRLATPGEQKLSSVKSGSIALSNRLRLGVVEANDQVKNQIYNMLVQKNHDDTLIAEIFGSQFMPYEGGGWINSRVWDVLYNPVAGQARFVGNEVYYTPGRFPIDAKTGKAKYTQGQWANNFKTQADLRFKTLQDGSVEFESYGKGMLVKKDDPIWGVFNKFKDDVESTFAKRNSVVSLVYRSKDGKQIIPEDVLQADVAAELKRRGIKKVTRAEWEDAANALYDKTLLATRVFDEGFLKLDFAADKHISSSGLRAISTYGVNEDEELLRDIFTSSQFSAVNERLGTDFTDGKTLVADIYYDAAYMDFRSPIWGNRKEAAELKQFVEKKVYNHLFGAGAPDLDSLRANDINAYRSAQEKIQNWFYNAMDKARHAVSDQVEEITHGGTVLGANMGAFSKYGNMGQSFYATLRWLELQIAEHAQTAEEANALSSECMNKAMMILLENNVLVDRSRQALSYTIYDNGQVVVRANPKDVHIDTEALRRVYGFNGIDIDTTISEKEINDRMNFALSPYINMKNNEIYATAMDVAVLKDTEGSDKLYKMTDREINTYYNILWEDKMLGRIKANMDDDVSFNKIYRKYLENGKLKQQYIGKSVFERDIDRFFKHDAFTRYGEGELSLKDKLFSPRQGTYRDKKMAELVDHLGAGVVQYKNGTKVYKVSNSYAEDLYEVASLQKARSFNLGTKNSISAYDLITDNGKANLGQGEFYFKEVDLLDVDTYADAAKELDRSRYNLHKHNLLVNLLDEEAGLNKLTLRGREQLALAGVSLAEGERAIPAEFQREFNRLKGLQGELRHFRATGNDAYGATLTEFNDTVEKIISLQNDYASGKIKTSKTARLQETRIPGSITGKVQVLNAEQISNSAVAGADDRLANKIVGKTYNGRKLSDYYKAGSRSRPNVAFIGAADLERMGFTEEYALSRGYASYEDFKDIVRTRGIAGAAHRPPSDYIGSTMQIQIYLDDTITGSDKIYYDEITAAFLKADADGDYATIMAHTAVDDLGERYDLTTAVKYRKKNYLPNEVVRDAIEATRLHNMHMNMQIYDLNRMVKTKTDYQKVINQTVDDYIKAVSTMQGNDPLASALIKNKRLDLRGVIRTVETEAPNATTRAQYLEEFGKYREDINKALGSIQNLDVGWQAKFTSADTSHAEAAGMLQEKIVEDRSFRLQLEKSLGNNLDAVNEAFINASTVDEAKMIAFQRMARKGAGLADTPYTAIDFMRMSAIGSGRNVLTNEENAAMYMVKEMSKEQLLTAKKGDKAVMARVSQSLDELSELMDEILQSGKNNKALEDKFVNFMSKTARDTNDRYAAESLLADFIVPEGLKDAGKIDNEKVYRNAYQGIIKAAEDMRQNTSINPRSYMELSRYFKGRVWDTYQPHSAQTYASRLNRAIKLSNGDFEMPIKFSPGFGNLEQQAMQRQAQLRGKDIIEKAVRSYRPSKGLAIAALGLAGAAVFGGYAGGNPARPAQQQAQEVYEQNPPPRNINMADPSLTASNRKQAGYVININAQTQRDKEYASRLITQAVTQNFQDTNVNVSMNVNQQPGNISGKDLMDYLEQVL